MIVRRTEDLLRDFRSCSHVDLQFKIVDSSVDLAVPVPNRETFRHVRLAPGQPRDWPQRVPVGRMTSE
jgi:hypothetical protein